MDNRRLDPSITDIMNRASPAIKWSISSTIITEGGKVPIPKVSNFTEARDYDQNFMPLRFITVRVGLDTLKYHIYPFRENLRVEARFAVKPQGGASEQYYTREYRAQLTQNFDQSLLSLTKEDEGTQNELNLMELTLQLQEDVEYDYQFYRTGGIFQNQTLESILRVMMAPSLFNNQLTVEQLAMDSTSILRGVDCVKPSRTQPLKNLIIEEDTKIVDLPGYLQEKYGIYASGCGWFLQNGFWYIYPKYDYTQFNKRQRTLTIINLNPDEYPSLDKSYLYSDDKVFILSSGYSTMDDQSESYAINQGNGMKYVRASDVRQNFIHRTNNQVMVDKNRLKHFVFSERRDGLFNAGFTEDKFTDNPYKETGRMTRGLGMTLTCNWDQGDPDLLYPGMPVQVLHTKGDELIRRQGNLLNVTTVLASDGKHSSDEYIGQSSITVFLSKEEIR